MGVIDFDLLPGNIGVLTINRPRSRNALNWEAMDAFAESVEIAHAIPDLGALIVTGEGEAFCAGGDLYELHEYPTHSDGLRLTTLMTEALNRLAELPYPTVAAVEGHALGGGAEVALACDVRVLSESAKFGLMHVRLAIPPAWGGGQRLLRQVGYAQALEWLASGTVLNAVEAYEFGLANRVVKAGQAFPAAKEMAEGFARQNPAAVQAIKRFLRAGVMLSSEEAASAEQAEFPDLWAAGAHHEASTNFVTRKRIARDRRLGGR